MATAIGVDQASKLVLLAASPTVIQPHAGDSVVTSWLGGFIGVDAGSNSGLALGDRLARRPSQLPSASSSSACSSQTLRWRVPSSLHVG